jgi:hypothetical protein
MLHPSLSEASPFDAGCDCPADAAGAWDCVDCPRHGADAHADLAEAQAAEIDAENAWLRAAEAPTAEDYCFEAWERARISPAELDRVYGDAPYC